MAPGKYPLLPRAVMQHLGAGFVWDQAGHLVTAYHVMEDCFRHNVQPRVRLVARGTSYRATFIGGEGSAALESHGNNTMCGCAVGVRQG